ncbi:MAG: hypothetical protein V4596_06830 [Bdellovibrionota bacterium]
MRKVVSCILLVMFCFVLDASTGKKRIELDDITTKELLAIIQQSEKLHKYMFGRKEPMVTSQINLLRNNIKSTVKKVKGQQGQHVSKILNAVNKELTSAQMTSGEDRVRYLQHAFKQIVMLYQSYEIKASYKVFFCKTDRAVWIQEDGKKPENPFQVTSNCGRKVF